MDSRSITAELEDLANQFEHNAASIRTTIAILRKVQQTRTVATLPAELASVVHAERQRTATAAAAKPTAAPKPKPTKAAARRTRTQQLLDLFHADRPTTPAAVYERLLAKGFSVKDANDRMRSMGALVRRDYLKKVGKHQYTRTERAFSVNGAPA